MTEDRRGAGEMLDLLDWKRRIFDVYREVRSAADPRRAWDHWRAVRRELITSHPQSPIRHAALRSAFDGPHYFDYDPHVRVLGVVEDSPPERIEIEGSADGRFAFTRFGVARFELRGEPQRLSLYWLEGYGGGVFLSFREPPVAGRPTERAGTCWTRSRARTWARTRGV